MSLEQDQSQEEYEHMLNELNQKFQTKDALYFYLLNKIVSTSPSSFELTVNVDALFAPQALLYS